jgi:hypothetical protein
VLVVEAERGHPPAVTPVPTGGFGWHILSHTFNCPDDLQGLLESYTSIIGNRVQRDLLRLELDGALGVAALELLDNTVETWNSRLLRLDRHGDVALAATEADITSLIDRSSDPLTARIASLLRDQLSDPNRQRLAEACLRELHLAVSRES